MRKKQLANRWTALYGVCKMHHRSIHTLYNIGALISCVKLFGDHNFLASLLFF